jgi:hypothetical protein
MSLVPGRVSPHRSPFGRSFIAVTLVWAVTIVLFHSNAGVAFPTWVALFGSGLVLAIAWLLWTLMAISFARRDGTGTAKSTLRAVAIVPAALAGAVLLSLTDVPLMVRVYLSSNALRGSARELERAPFESASMHWSGHRVGLFYVREFDRHGDELRFLTSQCGLVDNCGIVYSPAGQPPNRGEDSYRHLYGPWWHWHQSW